MEQYRYFDLRPPTRDVAAVLADHGKISGSVPDRVSSVHNFPPDVLAYAGIPPSTLVVTHINGSRQGV